MARVEIVKRSFHRSQTGADQWLLRDTQEDKYYVASGVSAMFSGWEVLVFPADKNGKITDWGEVAGGRCINHEEAVADLEERLSNKENADVR